MIYIVSGFMRSGTSMMMEALIAGGLSPAYSPTRDHQLNAKWGDPDVGYTPNTAYYELDGETYNDPNFPSMFEGRVLKCLYGGLERLKVGSYRCVFMRRPHEEIKTSCLAAFGTIPPLAAASDFDLYIETLIARVRDRRSFLSVDEVWYADVLADPVGAFTRLDWPIDAIKASAIPQTTKARFSA